MNLRRYFLLFFIVFFSAFSQAMPDRIGNGGGVWSCEKPDGEILDLMFMDIFEARREYNLEVPESSLSYVELISMQRKWIRQNLDEAETILPHLEYVEKNLTWISDIINLIPDGANKITPHPSSCRQGRWHAVQLVNFTDDYRILIRKDLFESRLMTEVERAAVFLHEALYSYLRTEFEDQNSVRARAIVGFLFSNLDRKEKLDRIRKVLDQAKPPGRGDPPSEPQSGWMCGIKPGHFSPLYTFEGRDRSEALEGVVKACKKDEGPFPIIDGGDGFPWGFPPNLPGVPLDIPELSTECLESIVKCEEIKTVDLRHTCTLQRGFSGGNTYRGQGRVQLEALKNVLSECATFENPSFCNSSARDVRCSVRN